MHPLQHKLTLVMKQIMCVLGANPKKTPTFDIAISDNTTYISVKGQYGKRMAKIIDQNGFWTGSTFSYAFYNTLDSLARNGKLITLSWRDDKGRVRSDHFQSRGQLLGLGEDGISKVRLQIASVPQPRGRKKTYHNRPLIRG
ncbi:MAG: hypothetical protein EOM37_00255 [Proteobacteria bacterium]|jgi:hypothetical protein|nr:hypothetical protein [Alphaproteobacteria bacterium]NCC02471.1 hypothetical protein [Pseudomonadota bacterium]